MYDPHVHECLLNMTQKSRLNLHYTRGITPKGVTSGRAHLRGSAQRHDRLTALKKRRSGRAFVIIRSVSKVNLKVVLAYCLAYSAGDDS